MSQPIENIKLNDISGQILSARAAARAAGSLELMPALIVLNFHGRCTLRQDRDWAMARAYLQTATLSPEGGEAIAGVTVIDDQRAKEPATLYLFAEARRALAAVEARSDVMHRATLQLIDQRVRELL